MFLKVSVFLFQEVGSIIGKVRFCIFSMIETFIIVSVMMIKLTRFLALFIERRICEEDERRGEIYCLVLTLVMVYCNGDCYLVIISQSKCPDLSNIISSQPLGPLFLCTCQNISRSSQKFLLSECLDKGQGNYNLV